MSIIDIAGPFSTEHEARETAKAIGANCSVYSVEQRDADGYGTGDRDWWVDQDTSRPSGKIFGYEANAFMARQYKVRR